MKTAAKDFKMTELGPIPKDWDVFELGENGHLVKNNVRPYTFANRVFAEYSMPAFDDGQQPDRVCGRTMLSERNGIKGAVLLFNKLNVRKRRVWYVPDCEENAVASGEFLAYVSDQVDLSLLRQILVTDKVTEDFEGMSCGTSNSQKRIAPNNFLEYCVALPSRIEEQRKIAAALSEVDEMIAALEKLIEKKRKIKIGAMQRLLTGKTRLPGFKGAWVEKRLGELGETYNGIGGKTKDDFGKGPARYITFLNVLTNPVLDETLFEPVNVLPADGQNRAKKGDLFFNTSSETPEEVGICSMLATDQAELYLNSFCFGFRLFDDNVSPLFLSYYFRSADGRLLMTTLAQGSTRYNLSKESFKEACIVIPPSLAEQKAIAKVLGDIDEEIAALEAELAKTRQLKQGMMQELLTGKVRLSRVVTPVVE